MHIDILSYTLSNYK